MSRWKLDAEARRNMILNDMLDYIAAYGFSSISCRVAAKASNCCYNTVQRQWPNTAALGRAITAYAKAQGDEVIYDAGVEAGYGED